VQNVQFSGCQSRVRRCKPPERPTQDVSKLVNDHSVRRSSSKHSLIHCSLSPLLAPAGHLLLQLLPLIQSTRHHLSDVFVSLLLFRFVDTLPNGTHEIHDSKQLIRKPPKIEQSAMHIKPRQANHT